MRAEMILRVRRNEDDIAFRKLEFRTVLDARSAARDNVRDDRWNHPPWRCLIAGAKLDKTARQRAERRHRVAAEDARITKGELALGEHRRLDHPRQNIDPLLLALLLDEARFVVVIVFRCGGIFHERIFLSHLCRRSPRSLNPDIPARPPAARCRPVPNRRRRLAWTKVSRPADRD